MSGSCRATEMDNGTEIEKRTDCSMSFDRMLYLALGPVDIQNNTLAVDSAT